MTLVETTTHTYYVRSSVLGNQTIAEVKPDGTKQQGNVYANGVLLAEHTNVCTNCVQNIKINEMNPLTGSGYKTAGDLGGADAFREERDPLGANTGLEDPWLYYEAPTYGELIGNQQPLYLEMGGNPFDPNGGCERDGMPYRCSALQRDIDNGTIEGQGSNGQIFSSSFLKNNVFWGTNSFSIFMPGTGTSSVRILPDGAKPSDASFGPGGSWQTFYFSNFGSSQQQTASQAGDDGIRDVFLKILKLYNNQTKCDSRLARIFGGPNAMMATLWESSSILDEAKDADGNQIHRLFRPRDNYDDESTLIGIVHLFANSQGTGESGINAFTPAGFSSTMSSHNTTSSGELQNFRRFYYAPGSLNRFGYGGGLIVNFTHIGPVSSNGDHLLVKKALSNSAGSTPIGNIGGFGSMPEVGGGSNGFYVHSHMIFNKWDGNKSTLPNRKSRIDPRSVFCRDLGF